MKVQAQITREFDVAAIKVSAQVRYWEDGKVGGVEDTDGTLIPLRKGDCWEPVIDIDAGRIRGWPEGTVAEIHYKVCDAGMYTLLDADGRALATREGYVPELLSPGDNGYGDYIIMDVNHHGEISNWDAEIDPHDWKWVAA